MFGCEVLGTSAQAVVPRTINDAGSGAEVTQRARKTQISLVLPELMIKGPFLSGPKPSDDFVTTFV